MSKLPVDVNPVLLEMQAYSPNRHPAPVELRLDGNEGPPPPEEILSLAVPGPEIWRRYPSARTVEALIARRHGVPPEAVLVTAGADDALERAIRVAAGPGRRVVLTEPTFEMLPRYVRLAGGTPDFVPWWSGPFPVDRMIARLAGDTAAVVVVSPNNPTGLAISGEELERLAAALGRRLLLLDHAYVELADADLTTRALALPNVLVFRTLSKAWGCAGLRVGYVAGRPEVVALLRRVGQPYPVSGPSLLAAEALLGDGGSYHRRYAEGIRSRRRRLAAALSDRGLVSLPSQANFVLARTPHAAWLRDALAGLGIAVRAFPGRPGLADRLRITVPAADEELDRLLGAIDAAMAPEALLFDMDGVLVDVASSYHETIGRTARRFGVELARGEIVAAKARGGANDDWRLTRDLLAAHGVDVPLDAVVEVFEALYQGTPDVPGLKEGERLIPPRHVLERLAARLPLAVVTGRPLADAREALERFAIGDLFATVVAMEDAPSKPDPAPVRLALERLGAARGWLVGDTPDDVRAARTAGAVPLGVVPPGRDDPASWTSTLLTAGAARVLPGIETLLEVLP
ncbi:MAG TPA: aminotransferase class I/II-fold pyridoxal phosphate-dependent enzyme [Acidobacteria bacterium]|nr:aminotransferase class I/II-fold pyridoxal phosphate-dependent enzyme [Acidobacteriota bacterium]